MSRQQQSPFDISGASVLPEASSAAAGRRGCSPCAACTVRNLTVCGSLEAEELHHLAAIVSNQELHSGQVLFNESEPADHVFNVTAGTIKVYKLLADGRCQITGFLFPGDFLGLANEENYAYTAEAVNTVMLCRFPRRKLEGLLVQFPHMEKRLLGMATHELAAAQEQMLLLGRKTAKERIASFLLMLSRNAARRGQRDNPISLPMTRADIGDYLGLTTETVSRTFTQLKKTGAIALQANSQVEIADPDELVAMADGL